MTDDTRIPAAAAWLGYGGALPFLALAADYAATQLLFPGVSLQAFLVYAAAILAFLGGVRWGAALSQREGQAMQLALSVLPALWAAGALLLPSPSPSVAVLALGFVLVGLLDILSPCPGAPAWMPRLRARLTALVLLAHVVLFLAL